MEKEVDGSQIEKAYTLRSFYDNNCIEVVVDSRHFRVSADEILKLLHLAVFGIEKKKVHSYLKVLRLVDSPTEDL